VINLKKYVKNKKRGGVKPEMRGVKKRRVHLRLCDPWGKKRESIKGDNKEPTGRPKGEENTEHAVTVPRDSNNDQDDKRRR